RLIAAGADGVTGAIPVTARPRPWNWTVGAAAHEPPMIAGAAALCASPGASEVEAAAGAAAAAAPDAVAARVASALPAVWTSGRPGMTVEDTPPPPPAPRADRAKPRPAAASRRQATAKAAIAGSSQGLRTRRSGAMLRHALGVSGISADSLI